MRYPGTSFYEFVLSDEQVKSAFAQRTQGVTLAPTFVVSGDDTPLGEAASHFLEWQLERLPWDQITEQMLYFRMHGYAVAELLWETARYQGQTVWCLKDIRPRNYRRFGFDEKGDLRLLTRTQPHGVPMPTEKFWQLRAYFSHSDDPYGRGLAHWLYWPVRFKRACVRDWRLAMEKFAQPTAIGKYPPGTPRKEQENLLNLVAALRRDASLVMPDTVRLELLESSRRGTGDDYREFYRAMNESIAKIILGSSMTLEQGSSRAQAQVHQEALHALVKSDSDLLSESFTHQVIRQLIAYNFPAETALPSVWRKLTREMDEKEAAEITAILASAGWQIDAQALRAKIGWGQWTSKTETADSGTTDSGTRPTEPLPAATPRRNA